MKRLNHLISGIVLVFSLFVLMGCQAEQLLIEGKTMGTFYSVKYQPEKNTSDRILLQQEIDKRLEQVNDQMSTYRSDSELSRFNAMRKINTPLTVSDATIKVINEARRIAALSDNTLDITAGPLVNLWGFGPDKARNEAPSDALIKERMAWIGLDKLVVEGNQLMKRVPQLYLDLSAIAKGYGVDVVADYLESEGITNYLVEIGGEVRAKGVNVKGEKWRIAIEKPDNDSQMQVQRIITLDNQAVATSGDYKNFFEVDGTHYSHTIDTKTGYPIENDIASLTVIMDSCMSADGFATAFGVLGKEKALALANKLDIAILIISKTETGFEESYSAAFAPFIQE